MAGEIRWIILLQKAPKGPFTTAEVESLISQGLVRRNDVAFQTLDGDSKAHTGWKFIWQFPEFEKRDGAPAPQKPKPHEPEMDRRQTPRKIEELPIDINSIRPDDLVLSARREAPKPAAITNESEGATRRIPLGWMVGTVGMAGLFLFYFAFSKPDKTPSEISPPKAEVVSTPKRSPASIEKRPEQRPPPREVEIKNEPIRVEPRPREDSPHDRREEPREVEREDPDRAPASEDDEEPVIVRKKRGKRPQIVIEDDEESDEGSMPAPDDEEANE